MGSYMEFTIKLLMACLIGSLIGYERERKGHPAGFRTHMIICVGSVLMTETSIFFHMKFGSPTSDPARIAAQIITGIGFLGAGAIIRLGTSIRGLTTAAGIWVTAGIGMAIGAGFYYGAVLTSIVTVMALTLLKKIEKAYIQEGISRELTILSGPGESLMEEIKRLLEEKGGETQRLEISGPREGEEIELKITLNLPGDLMRMLDLAESLRRTEGVRRVEIK